MTAEIHHNEMIKHQPQHGHLRESNTSGEGRVSYWSVAQRTCLMARADHHLDFLVAVVDFIAAYWGSGFGLACPRRR